jgi:hypothetical protein
MVLTDHISERQRQRQKLLQSQFLNQQPSQKLLQQSKFFASFRYSDQITDSYHSYGNYGSEFATTIVSGIFTY